MTSTTQTSYLTRPGEGRVAYDIRGTGPAVVLVPGMGELRSTYRLLAPLLVGAGYTVITCDLRGHGDSDATFSSYGDAQTAEDITALIRELGRPATVVGNSMAAGAAVIAAATSPDLVSSLILIGPFVRNPPSNAFQVFMFRAMMARPWAAAAWNAYYPSLNAGAKPADFEEYRRSMLEGLRRPGHSRAFRLTTRTDHAAAESALAAITTPTLVVMGELDPDFTDPRAEADWIARSVSADVVMVPDAGHYPHSQQPTRTADAVIGFLESMADRG